MTIPPSKSASEVPNSPSNKSVRSTRLAGSSTAIESWPENILTEYVCKGKQQKKNKALTEQALQEFNKRNALAESSRYSSSSPYYKGLTDFSLILNREKLSGGSSPGRESHATTSSSRTSFNHKFQEFMSSCFNMKKHEIDTNYSSNKKCSSLANSSSNIVRERGVTVTKMVNKTSAVNQPQSFDKKKVTFPNIESPEVTITQHLMKKPLREKYCGEFQILPLSPPQTSPPESLPYPLPHVSPPEIARTMTLLPAPSLQDSTSHFELIPEMQESADQKMMTSMKVKEGNYVWADTYRPFLLEDFICNKRTALWLRSIVRNWRDKQDECGHFIFEGNPGVGKRTMIWALLREAFGPNKVQAREECKKFYLKGEAVSSIVVNLLVSTQHVEINLSELKGYEKHVIVELIKENDHKLVGTPLHCSEENCRAIILHEAEKLSTDALTYIKWMLEKFKGCNKVFFCCRDASKLQLIKPLCTHVQLLEPSIDEILEVLGYIAKQERIYLSQQLANKIANNSKNTLRQAIRSFEATWHFSGHCAILDEEQEVKTGWEDKISNIAASVLEKQSPQQLYNIRGELQHLIDHSVAPEYISMILEEELRRIIPEPLKPQFENLYEYYQKNCFIKKCFYSPEPEEVGETHNDPKKNVQQFMMIEEFIARFMSWYKAMTIKYKDAE